VRRAGAADAFLTVYDRIGQYDSRRPFEPWFYRIVVTKALMTPQCHQRAAGAAMAR